MVHIPELNNDSNENTAVRPDIELNTEFSLKTVTV